MSTTRKKFYPKVPDTIQKCAGFNPNALLESYRSLSEMLSGEDLKRALKSNSIARAGLLLKHKGIEAAIAESYQQARFWVHVYDSLTQTLMYKPQTFPSGKTSAPWE
mgnify:FL=1